VQINKKLYRIILILFNGGGKQSPNSKQFAVFKCFSFFRKRFKQKINSVFKKVATTDGQYFDY
jgi:hypothetical protein